MNGAVDALPVEWYTDTAIYQAERRNIFANQWLYAASLEELRQPGDFVTTEIAQYPICLVRQADHTIKAFHNICRHRAAPLLNQSTGHLETGTLTCRYHGWSYNTAGELLAAPYFDCLTQCDREEYSLFPVQVHEYNDLIFVNLAPEAPAFSSAYSELIQVVADSECKFSDYAYHSKITREGSFNWKVWMDGYQECYHCTTIHPIFSRDFMLQQYKVENHERFSIHSCKRKVESQSGAFSGLWLWVYPNLGMPVYEPCFYTLQVNPLGVAATRLTYTFHFRKDSSEELIGEFTDFVEQVTSEDINICEAVHRNMESGIFRQGVLHATRENGVAYFHSLVRAAVSGTTTRASDETISACR